ncbi:MAG: RNA methyltransferase [Desulfovibrio sp.]|nr:RNA methyltransferase [Desulfovibrio sp.]
METHHHTADTLSLQEDSLLPGSKPVLELLRDAPEKVDLVLCRQKLSGKEIGLISELCRKHAIRFQRVADDLLDKICRRQGNQGCVAHQGLVARVRNFAFYSLETLLQELAKAPLPLLVALDQVQDPGNIGTLARTLYSLGGAGLIVPMHNSARIGPAARRAAAGCLERLPIARVTNLGHALDCCEEHGLCLYGASGHSQHAHDALTTPMQLPAVLVLGNEERGLRPEIAKRCSLLMIPHARKFDSLNVAQAGAILIGLCLARQRNEKCSEKAEE